MTNRKILPYLLALAFCAGMTSCRRAVEKAGRKIRIEAVERVEPHGRAGLDITLRVRNDTRHRLLLQNASLDLYDASARVASAKLRQKIEVPRRTTDSYVTQWRVRAADPLALYVLLRRIRRNDLSGMAVSFSVEGRGGPATLNISHEKMPLSDFLNIFGVDSEELKNRFEP